MADRTQRLGGPIGLVAVPDPARLDLGPDAQIGDWITEHTLGIGGFGTVYRVRSVRTQQRAALKLLHAQLVTSTEMLARFAREIEVLRRLDHPHIVSLVDAGFTRDGSPYLCMELLEGDHLARAIELRGPLAPADVLDLFEPLADAVAAAHARDVIHRDLKASNVMLCPGGRVVLLDFGIAKLADALAPELTASRQSIGTPSCMAPEQIEGRPVDARTDVYGLGALLFETLTGRPPFTESSATMTQYLHLHARRPLASSLAEVPRAIDDVIVRAMAVEPADRFDGPRALVSAIRTALRDTAIVPVSPTEIRCHALLVSVTDREPARELDEHVLADRESILPAIERALSPHGFELVLDLGPTAVFLARADDTADPAAIAVEVFDRIAARPGRDARVRIGIAVHRGTARYAGAELQDGPLLHPSPWSLPALLDGVWITSAIAEPGRYVR